MTNPNQLTLTVLDTRIENYLRAQRRIITANTTTGARVTDKMRGARDASFALLEATLGVFAAHLVALGMIEWTAQQHLVSNAKARLICAG